MNTSLPSIILPAEVTRFRLPNAHEAFVADMKDAVSMMLCGARPSVPEAEIFLVGPRYEVRFLVLRSTVDGNTNTLTIECFVKSTPLARITEAGGRTKYPAKITLNLRRRTVESIELFWYIDDDAHRRYLELFETNGNG